MNLYLSHITKIIACLKTPSICNSSSLLRFYIVVPRSLQQIPHGNCNRSDVDALRVPSLTDTRSMTPWSQMPFEVVLLLAKSEGLSRNKAQENLNRTSALNQLSSDALCAESQLKHVYMRSGKGVHLDKLSRILAPDNL